LQVKPIGKSGLEFIDTWIFSTKYRLDFKYTLWFGCIQIVIAVAPKGLLDEECGQFIRIVEIAKITTKSMY
jgi:hypothetical protein